MGLIVSILFAQNAGNPDTSQIQGGNAPAGFPGAHVTVTPGPQGLSSVNSYFSPWPLGTALQDSFPQGFPGLEGVPGFPAENPAQTTAQTRQTSSSRSGGPASSSQNSTPVTGDSPVYYDRAGRRVVDSDQQETVSRTLEAKKEAAETAQETPAVQEIPVVQEAPAAESAGRNDGPETPDTRTIRETVFVVPGPAVWRIRGTFTAAKGMLTLEDDDGVLWYLPGLDRYIGFIDGLDFGQKAALEGYAPPRGSSQERFFQPIKLFIDEMEYDLAVPPEGVYLGGQTSRAAAANQDTGDQTNRNNQKKQAGDDTVRRQNPPAPQPWQHNHKSPWAPPASVFDFQMDYDSFWQAQDDPAKQERREQDSREIWY
ncbi:MAG: hypothetical protein LBI94_03340 [Treponema sp.]|nr:hypothetical protein [Treponema sp.]